MIDARKELPELAAPDAFRVAGTMEAPLRFSHKMKWNNASFLQNSKTSEADLLLPCCYWHGKAEILGKAGYLIHPYVSVFEMRIGI